MEKLTPKQERFCEEYIVDLNATQAAIRAGYSERTANEQGAQLLAKLSIQQRMQELQAERSKRTAITQDRVVQELAAIAFANATDYAQVIRPGVVRITPTAELSAEQVKAVAGIKEGANGIEVKLNDKVKALELLGRHLGMFNDKLELSGAVSNPFAGLSIEELQRLAVSDG